jgi:hypothetical protein
MVLIAAALPRLEIEPAFPLPRWEGNGALPAENTPEVLISVSTFFKAIIGVVIAMVLAFSSYKLLKGIAWKDLLGPLLFIALVIVVALIILFVMANVHITFKPLEAEILPPALKSNGPPLGPPPAGLIWLVWIGLAVVIALLGIWLIKWRTKQIQANDPLKLEAERAMQALQTGLDLRSVIVHCYRQMSLALQREQGIELEETMTAREFERLLEVRGFPHAPVHQLTQLFEVARYGVRPLNASDEQNAFDCLNTIVQHSREGRPSH